MSARSVVIAPIYGITVDENLGRGEKLDDTLLLTNDRDTAKRILPAQSTRYIGILECDSVSRAGLVAYGHLSDGDCPANPSDIEEFLFRQLLKLHELASFLWMVKDHAIRIENAFFIGSQFGSTRIFPLIASFADGRHDVVSFSRVELRTARDGYRHVFSDKDMTFHQSATPHARREIVDSAVSPGFRALLFARSARTSSHLSIKIANYCSALESVLVSTPTELTFRLAQRVAWLLGATIEERQSLFRQLKSAYDIRSTAVHGSSMSDKKLHSALTPAVSACDEILRRILQRLSEDQVLRDYVWGQVKNATAFEERLLAITLGDDSEAT